MFPSSKMVPGSLWGAVSNHASHKLSLQETLPTISSFPSIASELQSQLTQHGDRLLTC